MRVVCAPGHAWLALSLALVACSSGATAPRGDTAGGATAGIAGAAFGGTAGSGAGGTGVGTGGSPAGGDGASSSGAPNGGGSATGGSIGGSGGASGTLGGAGSPSGGASGAGTSSGGASGAPGGASGAGAGPGGTGPAGGAGASGGGAGTSACDFAFCEDFESGRFDASRWTVAVTGSNTATVTTARAAHGTHAAEFHYAGTRATWAFAHADLDPALATHHFGRANVYLTPRLPARHTIFVTAGTTGFPLDRYLEVSGNGTSFQLTAVDLPNDTENYQIGGTLPTGRWFCMEWEFGDTPDRATLFVDSAEALTKSFTIGTRSSGIVGGFAVLGIGLRAWGTESGDTPYDLFYDDVAIDAERVGCPP